MKLFSRTVQFLSLLCLTTSSATSDNNSQEKINAARLHGKCTIDILKTKLAYANGHKKLETQEDSEEFIKIFQNLYDECCSVINPQNQTPQQPNLSQEDWIRKCYQEIGTLRQNDTTRNCFNQAMLHLKTYTQAQTQEEKESIIKLFHAALQNCSYQHALETGLQHLNAQVERWSSNKEAQEYDFIIWTMLLKHTPQEQPDFQEDLQKAYNAHVTQISFEEFTANIKRMVSRLQNNPIGRSCLEKTIQFKKIYDSTQTSEQKEILKKDFAIPYMQCKQL